MTAFDLSSLGIPDAMLIAGPAALFILFLLVRIFQLLRRPARTQIVLDASNIMYWKDETPKASTVREVLRYLRKRGYAPGVIFDANVGYLLTGKYQNDEALAKMLRLKAEEVIVVGSGTPADPVILNAARELGTRIVTNDRYRDWMEDYPEIRIPGHLVRGSYKTGKLRLDIE